MASLFIRVCAGEEGFAGPRQVVTATGHTTGVLVFVGDEWKSGLADLNSTTCHSSKGEPIVVRQGLVWQGKFEGGK